MLSHEIINEETHIDDGITERLKELGYKFLGNGVDQQAWLEPNTGYVLKIFGTSSNGTFSTSQKMFYRWAKFCEKNKDNEFLPKFYGIETFVFNNDNYIQFRQEKLVKTKLNLMEITQDMVESADKNKSFKEFVKQVKNNAEWYPLSYRALDDDQNVTWMKKFYKTIMALNKIADKKGWTSDIHSDNVMMRQDGTPVIIDPWFAGWGNS
jgi:hypothetical protein